MPAMRRPQAAPLFGTDDHVEPLQAELKHVTVLFVDLVSSTELVAHLDAEIGNAAAGACSADHV